VRHGENGCALNASGRNRDLEREKMEPWEMLGVDRSRNDCAAEAGEEEMDMAAERWARELMRMSPTRLAANEPETKSMTRLRLLAPLAARFDALVEKYPVKRSALVPMLLYAQDEIGYLSDAVIAEVARRIGITELEVRNVATYYSMLRFKPAGKYNMQVCTNISCMLRGAYESTSASRKSSASATRASRRRLFSLEEVECIGACCWAPAIQVNYDFHDELKPDLVPGILAYAQLSGQALVFEKGRKRMPRLVSHPDEVKIVSRRFGMGAANIDRYIELGGYEAAKKCLAQGPDWIIERDEGQRPARPRRRGLSTGMKWSFVPKQSAKPKYVLVNGDESEPGTCKDHLIFLHDPHAVIEGTIIAGLAIGAKMGFIYLRGEYRYLLESWRRPSPTPTPIAAFWARTSSAPTPNSRSSRRPARAPTKSAKSRR
jgi:NADH-quinone oxidoreductase subunit E